MIDGDNVHEPSETLRSRMREEGRVLNFERGGGGGGVGFFF